MNILVIGRSFPEVQTGMRGVLEFEQAYALARAGHRVSYIFLDIRSPRTLRRLAIVKRYRTGVHVYGAYCPAGDAANALTTYVRSSLLPNLIKKALKREGAPDIIHVHEPLLTLNNVVWAFLRGINKPIVVTQRGQIPKGELPLPDAQLMRRVVEEADAYLFIGERPREAVLQTLHMARAIGVVSGAVSPLFRFRKESPSEGSFTFLAVSDIAAPMRFDMLIDAFAQAFADAPDVYLSIVGEGPMARLIKSKIQQEGLVGRVALQPLMNRRDMANYMSRCDALVSTNALEQFIAPIAEALACGKPVIAVENGMMDAHVLATGGILYKAGDAGALAGAMRILYQNRGTYSGQAISNYASIHFHEGALIRNLLEIYQQQDCGIRTQTNVMP